MSKELVVTEAHAVRLTDRTIASAKSAGSTTWGPFKITYTITAGKVVVTVWINAFGKDWKIGTATLTEGKSTATLSIEIKHLVRAAVSLKADFVKRKLEVGVRSCYKELFKWKCNPKKGYSWRTIASW